MGRGNMGNSLSHVVKNVGAEGTLSQPVGSHLGHHLLAIVTQVVVFQVPWVGLLVQADLAHLALKGSTSRTTSTRGGLLLLKRNANCVVVKVVNWE